MVILGARPDLMLLTVVAWGLLRGTREGIVWGFLGGVLSSFFSGGPFAYVALVLIAVGFLSGLGQTTVARGRIALPVLSALLATLIHGILSLCLLYVTGYGVTWIDSIVRVLLPTAALNCLLSIPVHALLRMLHRRTSPEELRW
jgi:rod shape-determining protein MreD